MSQIKMDIYVVKLELAGYLSTWLAKKKFVDRQFRPGTFLGCIRSRFVDMGMVKNEAAFITKRSVDMYERKLLELRTVKNPSIDYDVEVDEAREIVFTKAKEFIRLYNIIVEMNKAEAVTSKE